MDRRPSTTAVFGKPQIDIECSDHECEAMLPPAKVVADDNAATRPLLETLWRSGVCCLLPLLFLYVVALGMMAPRFPGLMADEMASRQAGSSVRCAGTRPEEQPAVCLDASSTVVWWSSCSHFITQAVLTFSLAPLVGRASDVLGRRPFLMGSLALAVMPGLVMLGHVTLDISLLLHYPASILAGGINLVSICFAYAADLLPPCHRAAGFGILLASTNVGVIVGPLIGSQLSVFAAACSGCVIMITCNIYIWAFVPESLSWAAKQKARQQCHSARGGITSGVRMLMRTPLFRCLTLCLLVSGMVNEFFGIFEVMIQYLKIRFGFTVSDVTVVFVIFGGCGLIVQAVVLKALLKRIGEARVLAVGLAAGAMQMLALALITAKWQAFVAIAAGTLGTVAFPAICSIKANNVDESEQGAVQGALCGVKALAAGVGPLMMASVFAGFTRTDGPLPFFPGAPFLVASILLAGGLAVALALDASAGRDEGGGASAPRGSCSGGNSRRDQDSDHCAGGLGEVKLDDNETAALNAGRSAQRPPDVRNV